MTVNLLPLSRPGQVEVKVEATAKTCDSEGFTFPPFRLLNKQARIRLSTNGHEPQAANQQYLFSIANSRGWFAAVTSNNGYSLVLSPLEDLRSNFKANAEDSFINFTPKRTLSLTPAKPISIVFACNDARLVVVLEQGPLLIYDTTVLFSPGAENISPLSSLQTPPAPIRQVCPNPGTEANLMDIIAVVFENGTVQLFNPRLEPQGGWATDTNSDSKAVAVAWSPKGKHIAVGLRSGDILTFSLTNTAVPHKHIPPTAAAPLKSLDWLSPGHTFRTVYTPPESDPVQHIVCLDIKSSTVTHFLPNLPFALPDRPELQPFIVHLPRWEQDASSPADSSLLVVGDRSSVDLEILGSSNGQWYQQLQENPLSLPLDSNMDDTTLIGLEVDLTDTTTGHPVMYAYLNDGTIQGWSIESSKPYSGIITPQATLPSEMSVSVTQAEPQLSTFGQRPSAFASPSAFGSQPTSAFGITGFGQPSASAFRATPNASAFAQASAVAPSAFAQTAQNQPVSRQSAFGPSTGGFGSGAPTFGGFGSAATSGAAFGQPGFGFGASSSATPEPAEMKREVSMSDETTTPSLGGLSLGNGSGNEPQTPKASIFGALPSAPAQPAMSTFGDGGLVKPATGFGAFSNFQPSASTGGGGQIAAAPTVSAFGGDAAAQPSSAFGQSGFGQPSFGKSGFGQSAFGQTGFGKPVVPTSTNKLSSGGFGAFASASPVAFGASTTQKIEPTPSSTSGGFAAFASGGPSAFSSFGQAVANKQGTSPFGQSTTSPFGKSPFGATAVPAEANKQPDMNAMPSTPSAFRDTSSKMKEDATAKSKSFTIPTSPPSSPEPRSPQEEPVALTTTPTSSPFKPVAPAPATGAFANLKSSPSAFKPAAGFGAFGSTTPTTSPFFKAAEGGLPPVSAFGQPASPTPTTGVSAFGSPSPLGSVKSAFGAPSTLGAAKPSLAQPTTASASSQGGFSAFAGGAKGFSAFAGAQKSFGDLLKQGDEDVAKVADEKPVPVFASVVQKATLETKVTLTELSSSAAKEQSVTLTNEAKPTTVTLELKEKEPEKLRSAEIEEKGPEKAKQDQSSFESLSMSSVASSFVEVSTTVEGKEEESEEESEQEEAETEEPEAEAEEAEESESFESDNYSTESLSEDHRSEEEVPESPEPAAIPLPESRSPSATPQPESPRLKAAPTTPIAPARPPSVPVIKEEQEVAESTTPPGSPAKEPTLVIPKTAPAVPSSPSPPSFGFGLGRPSTRPARSSPLATAPVSLNDEETEEEAASKEQPQQPIALKKPIPEETKPARPKTPPAPSPPPKSTSAPPLPVMTPATTKSPYSAPPSAMGQIGARPAQSTPLFPSTGQLNLTSSPQTPTPVPTNLFQGPSKGFLGFASTSSTLPSQPSMFGTAKPAALLSPQAGPSTPPVKPFSLAGAAPSTLPAPFPKVPAMPSLIPVTPKATIAQPPPPQPQPDFASMAEGMQKECALLYLNMNRELEELRLLAEAANKKLAELKRPAGGSRSKVDLGDPTKWSLADAVHFGHVLQQYGEDLDALKAHRVAESQLLRELQTNMLRANTRKEEIIRFNKAKNDAEFAKMLKARTLGPEHLETQTHLRRNITALRDRIQKLEDKLAQSKKRLAQYKSGKPSIKAPSLDTINRTYRNIDVAIERQADEVASLASRIAKLNVSSASTKAWKRDPRLPDHTAGRPHTVTPNIATTTAAALNAERSAQRLKRALLAARKEPLLNKKSAASAKPPSMFNTPQKPGSGPKKPEFQLANGAPSFPSSFSLASSSTGPSTPTPNFTPGWSLPEDNFNPSTPPPPSRRGAGSSVKKHSTVQLKRSPGSAFTPTVPTFDWGPLPTFGSPSGTSLVDAVKVTPPKAFVPLTKKV